MRAQQQPVTTVSFGDEEVNETSANTTGEFSKIIDIQVPQGMKYEFPAGYPIQMFIPTHETATATASSTTTVSLANDLVNSPSVSDVPQNGDSETATTGQYSLVVWDESVSDQVGVDSVNYDGDSFDYVESGGADSTLQVFYLWGDSSQVEFRTRPGSQESFDTQHKKTMREFHSASVFTQDQQVTFPESFTLREKEHLEVVVKTDVDLTSWDAAPGDGSGNTPGGIETYGYADFNIPVRRVPV